MVALLDEMMVDCWVDTKDVYLVDQRVEKWAESMVDYWAVKMVELLAVH
jgi:hypothetical protein